MDPLSLTERALSSLWRASWQASVLVVLVILAQWMFGRRLAPQWRYALWFLGVMAFGMRLAWGNYLFGLQLRRRTPVSDPDVLAILGECRGRLGLRRDLTLVEAPELDSPALFGCFRLYQERLGAPGGYYASLVASGGNIYAASDRGFVTVFAAGDTLKVLARNDLGEPISATPAIATGRLYVRTASQLYCFSPMTPSSER